jgi:hypothetical protein
MRAFLIGLVCLAALAVGIAVAAVTARHSLELGRLWEFTSAVIDWVAPRPPSPDEPGWQDGTWTPPKEIPAKANWTWHTNDGRTYEQVVITDVNSTEVTINHSLGIAHVPLDMLPVEVQRELDYTPNSTGNPATPGGLTRMAAMLNGKLIDLRGQPVATPGPSVKYYAIYYSAGWYPPCRAFTPSLVDWYRKFKPFHHDFELVFVSEDKNELKMYEYMQEMNMPWPAVRYADLPRSPGGFRGPDIQQFAHDSIPDLVLVDSTGKVLADSFAGIKNLGPQSVVDYMNDKLSLN